MTVKLNDKRYTVQKISKPVRFDAYLFKGSIHEQIPSLCTLKGYVETDEGVLAVCTRRLFYTVLFAAIIALIGAALVPTVVKHFTPPVEKFNVSYSAELVVQPENIVDINFINGEYPIDITIASLEGESEWYHVEPNGHLQSITLGFSPSDAVSEAFLVMHVDSYEYTFPLILYINEDFVEYDVYEEGVIS